MAAVVQRHGVSRGLASPRRRQRRQHNVVPGLHGMVPHSASVPAHLARSPSTRRDLLRALGKAAHMRIRHNAPSAAPSMTETKIEKSTPLAALTGPRQPASAVMAWSAPVTATYAHAGLTIPATVCACTWFACSNGVRSSPLQALVIESLGFRVGLPMAQPPCASLSLGVTLTSNVCAHPWSGWYPSFSVAIQCILHQAAIPCSSRADEAGQNCGFQPDL
jgi:hypothetical protein